MESYQIARKKLEFKVRCCTVRTKTRLNKLGLPYIPLHKKHKSEAINVCWKKQVYRILKEHDIYVQGINDSLEIFARLEREKFEPIKPDYTLLINTGAREVIRQKVRDF